MEKVNFRLGSKPSSKVTKSSISCLLPAKAQAMSSIYTACADRVFVLSTDQRFVPRCDGHKQAHIAGPKSTPHSDSSDLAVIAEHRG